MESPLCEICLKSDMLCPGCSDKINRGIISDEDVNTARIIFKVSQEHKLQQLGFTKTIGTKDLLVIVVEKGQLDTFLKTSASVMKAITKKIKKRVRVIEKNSDLKELTRDLLRPAKVLGINVLYKSAGEKQYNIKIEKREKKKLPAPKWELENLIKTISGKEVKLVG